MDKLARLMRGAAKNEVLYKDAICMYSMSSVLLLDKLVSGPREETVHESLRQCGRWFQVTIVNSTSSVKPVQLESAVDTDTGCR